MEEIRFCDKVIFATTNLGKSIKLTRKNAIASITSIGLLTRGDMEHWSYTRSSMLKRKQKRDIHVKIAKATMMLK